jgi:halimadienyl-diphosphate synthase
MELKAEARQLVRGLNERMGSSPYDTAWLARLKAHPDGDARWPDLLEWLLENQHPDGSWGGEILYYHDRVICTLAAAIALRENGHTHQAQEAVARAERYLWHHLHLLPRDPFELVGFELILPTLLAEARSLHLDVPNHSCGYGRIRASKLRLIPPEMIYSPRISTVHSLEFLGWSGQPERLRQALASNGSLGNSPATTGYYLLNSHDDNHSLAYLESVRAHLQHVIYLYPFRTFELTWVLRNLAFSGVPVTEFASQEIWLELESEMTHTGIGLDPAFGISDGDITSVCTWLLINAGYDVDPLVLSHFEDKHTHSFRTYDYERNASVGTNVHALEALSLMPGYPERREVQDRIIALLLGSRTLDVYWVDKWHASPYYATAHALLGLLKEGFYLADACRYSVDWLLHTQRDDGSWGFFQRGTLEETAYALAALCQYSQHQSIDVDILHRGAAYLERNFHGSDPSFPELWIGKCLYVPYDIVRSAILAALILYHEIFGRSP